MKLPSVAALVLLLASVAAGTAVHATPVSGARELVTAYFRQMFEEKNVEAAMEAYVAPDLIQHDPYLPDGAAAMTDFFVPYFEQHPQSSVQIKRVLADGDVVTVLSLWKESPEDNGQAAVDIYRVESGRIVEQWRVSQEIPDHPANRNTMF